MRNELNDKGSLLVARPFFQCLTENVHRNGMYLIGLEFGVQSGHQVSESVVQTLDCMINGGSQWPHDLLPCVGMVRGQFFLLRDIGACRQRQF